MIKSNKGQIALEALVIFGILVVGSIIFGLFYMNNVRDILVEGPGTKQDKNSGGGEVYDDLEGSLIYNGEEQIGSSSFGMSEGNGTGGGGGTDGPEDPSVLFCGDGTCNNGETIITCAQDCFAGYFVTNLELELLPEDIAYTNTKITINATLESDAPLVQISQINIKKYDGDDYAYYETTDCGLTGYDNNYTYLNVGELLPSEPGFLTGSFDFFCNIPGYYEFTFSLNNGGNEISNYIYKEILQPPLEFISVWDTKKTSYGSSLNNQIILPLVSDGIYDFIVDWGDNTTSHITSYSSIDKMHTYATSGLYTIKITGKIKGFSFDLFSPEANKIITINNWGPLNLGNSGNYFNSAFNLNIPATDILDLNGTTNLENMFLNCVNLTEINNINSWNVSNVTDMSSMFQGASSFNQPLSSWNVSNVTDMSSMFQGAFSFNQPLSSWNVSNVTDMSGMFWGASSFNQPLSSWNVSNVTDMSSMFSGASSFNQPLSSWNVSNVTDMSSMFLGASSFNLSLNNWNVSNVTNMSSMFSSASSFNQSLDSWDVSNVTNMSSMFLGASSFNQSLDSWDVSNVTNMSYMFTSATNFNGSIKEWDLSNVNNLEAMFWNAFSFNKPINDWYMPNVTSLNQMFYNASSFNQPLDNWDVSNISNMSYLFAGSSNFNQNINNWNVSNVTKMSNIFSRASSFNQPLNNWDVSTVNTMNRMFSNATSFNQPLNNWNVSNVTDMSYMFTSASSFNQDIRYWNVSGVIYFNHIFSDCPIFKDYKPEKFK